jgi:hypothetical protein
VFSRCCQHKEKGLEQMLRSPRPSSLYGLLNCDIRESTRLCNTKTAPAPIMIKTSLGKGIPTEVRM